MHPRVAGSTRLLLTLLLLHSCAAINWLGLHRLDNPAGSIGGFDKRGLMNLCQKLHRQSVLTAGQLRFCRRQAVAARNPEALTVLVEAARATVAVCREQFRYFRWNCSSLRLLPRPTQELQALTAEQAMVRALSGFVLTTTLAAECARGRVAGCPCGGGQRPAWLDARLRQLPATRGQVAFKLEGCQANLKMGAKLARRFLSLGRPRKKQQRQQLAAAGETSGLSVDAAYRQFAELLGRHNYLAGVRAAAHADAVRCKCHGTSAACTIRTCHRAMVVNYGGAAGGGGGGLWHLRRERLSEAASWSPLDGNVVRRSVDNPLDILMRMYDTLRMRKAIFDETGYRGYEEACPSHAGKTPDNPLSAGPGCFGHQIVAGLPPGDALLFHEHSLDYCSATHGRECLADDSPDGRSLLSGEPVGEKRREALCSVMCCGRPHAVRTVTYDGTHPECKMKTCRLLQRPFRVVCQPCTVSKAFCS